VDLLINDVLLVALRTVKALDDALMPRAIARRPSVQAITRRTCPRALDPGVGCNAPII
jgi:hypothetical protein